MLIGNEETIFIYHSFHIHLVFNHICFFINFVSKFYNLSMTQIFILEGHHQNPKSSHYQKRTQKYISVLLKELLEWARLSINQTTLHNSFTTIIRYNGNTREIYKTTHV